MKYSAAMSADVERACAAIAAIAADRDVLDASDALQEIGTRVMREIESLSHEVAIVRAATQRRKSHAR